MEARLMKQFGLRTMFLAVSAICVALVAGIWLKERLETKSLASCLAEANAAAAQDTLGRQYAPLAEADVYRWLDAYLVNSGGPDEWKRELRRIVRTGRLPLSAQVHGQVGSSISVGWLRSTPHRYWYYMLSVDCGPSATWGVEIPAWELHRSNGVNWEALFHSAHANGCEWLAVIL
jgi:hypothetical protein